MNQLAGYIPMTGLQSREIQAVYVLDFLKDILLVLRSFFNEIFLLLWEFFPKLFLSDIDIDLTKLP